MKQNIVMTITLDRHLLTNPVITFIMELFSNMRK
jgi:hypothetical protein